MSTELVDAWVPGDPKAQPRPRAFARGNRIRMYDPGTAAAWKARVIESLRPWKPERQIDAPVLMVIEFYLPRPQRLLRAKDSEDPISCGSKPDLDNLIKAVTAKPGGISFGSPGVGTPHHLSMELFKNTARVFLTHIPYRGAGPAVQDLLGGQVDLFITTPASVVQHIKADKLKGLAVTSARRLSFAPNLPTVAESGIPGYEVTLWAGFFAQPGVPREVVSRINAEVNRALKLADVRERLSGIAAEVLGGTPEDLSALVKTDFERYGRIARENRIRAD